MTIFKTSDYSSDIVLGAKYRDEQTGVEGTATAIHFYQHACERVTLENVKKDGELVEYSFDAPRLTNLETKKQATVKKTGGPARAEGGRSTIAGGGR